MPELGSPPAIAILIVASVALAVALPVVVVRRTARATDLRERILLSRPRWVEAHSIVSIVAQCIGAAVFAVLAVVGHPILWGVVVLSVGSIVATSLYLHRYRRALRDLEGELAHPADAEGDRRV